ncbi:MarR family transcriptional regulator [Paenibacillus sp. D9]|uniref:MarR family winged helix-turn-helix transcriptional regulator n=1 Tax=Paenibacillus sp. D9 TaxID=665792 RepID=UPI00061ECCD7|nr:MarR family transcriptional regulator [Paenibacillus sp. D9]KKC45890.1 MarR family transcriptional regulator [Paenibacillus sp. D9]
MISLHMQTIVDSYAKLQDANMTAPQYSILQTLAHEGSRTSSELAAKLGVTPSAVTNLSGKLVDKGYIERVVSEEDRRHVHLRITESGRAAEQRLVERFLQLTDGLWTEFSAEELDLLIHSYEKMIAHLQKRIQET